MNDQNLLFTPMEINSMHLKNRLMRSATYEHMATEDGNVTDQLKNLISRRRWLRAEKIQQNVDFATDALWK